MNKEKALTLLHLGLAVKPVQWENTYFKLSKAGKLLTMYGTRTGMPYRFITLREFEGDVYDTDYERYDDSNKFI